MILVTGGFGYIGSHVVRTLLERGDKVLVIDNLFRGYKQLYEVFRAQYGKDKLYFEKVDLLNKNGLARVFSKYRISGVLHFAALCLVNESVEKPEMYFENNNVGTLNLLVAMKQAGVKSLVFSSTCAVYGETQYLPVDENHPTNPVNPYGESKLISERMIRWFGGLNYVIFRYFNVAGAADDGSIGDSKRPSQLLMQNAVRGALGIEPFSLTCPKVQTRDGTPVRDYVNVMDLAEGHVIAYDYLTNGGKSEVINLGSGVGTSVLEIVTMVKEIVGVNFEVGRAEPRKGEYAEIYASNRKAKAVLGWEPKRSLKESVQSLVTWYKSRPKGWDY